MASKLPSLPSFDKMVRHVYGDISGTTSRTLAKNLITTEHPFLGLLLSPSLPMIASAGILGGAGIGTAIHNNRTRVKQQDKQLKALEKLWEADDTTLKRLSAKSNAATVAAPTTGGVDSSTVGLPKSVFAADPEDLLSSMESEDTIPIEEHTVSSVSVKKASIPEPKDVAMPEDDTEAQVFSTILKYI
jgi:hypothetical protein